MMSGFDRYYQIVKCFRDEDLRADRQPEFTQIDIEFSFANETLIQSITEKMIRNVFKTLLQVELPPFPVLTYQDAMRKYGSDKPDLRIPLELVDIIDIAKNTSFPAFLEAAENTDARIVALSIPKAADLSRKQLDDYAEFVKSFKMKGLAYIKVNDVNQGIQGLQSPVLKFFDEATLLLLLKRVHAQTGDLIFIGAGHCDVVNDAFGALRIKLGKDRHLMNQAWSPCWVVDFPMFEFSDGRWYAKHHPFTSPKIQHLSELDSPKDCAARAYDLVINGTEIGGGSIRINQMTTQKTVFKTLGISEKEAEEKFGFLLEAMKYGCPPHGGIALGLDRLAMHMVGADSIRDVIAFPKTTNASCPLTDAPSTVSKEQLDELKIKLKTDQ
jgi:aspartyl-tRNA synthetase